MNILNGIRVLDFGRFIAGPYCAALLADFGADVIRVEKRGSGEDRQLLPVVESGEGPLFLQCNRNKRGICLDTRMQQGRVVLQRLVASSDIVIANLPDAGLKKIGIDFTSLQTMRKDIILISISGYGHTGPYKDRLGFDGTLQAMSGSVYLSGEKGMPSRSQTNYIDFGTATGAAMGALAALRKRDQTGAAVHCRSSLLGTALAFSNNYIMEEVALGKAREPMGNQVPSTSPANIYPTLDGHILVHVIGAAQFKRLATLLERDDWLLNPDMSNDMFRANIKDEIEAVLVQWLSNKRTVDVAETFAEVSIPASSVYSPQEVMNDAHVKEVGFFQTMEYAGTDRSLPVAQGPVSFELDEAPAVMKRAPTTGEHTEAVLQELGYNLDEIMQLRTEQVI